MKTILTIAGFDPSSGAGVTADLAVFAAHRCFGIAAVTALTVQSTVRVQAVEPVPAPILRQTLRCLCEDLPPDGVKIGMLATAENVSVVADFLTELQSARRAIPVVVDPVIQSSSGRELLSRAGLAMLQERLLPVATWVTPNLPELSRLGADDLVTPFTGDGIEDAAARLQRSWPHLGVIVKGGHLPDSEGADDLVLTPEGSRQWLTGKRIQSRATHGTGCAFSSALVSRLVEGLDGIAAAKAAKDFVAEAIRQAVPLGRGHGPMNLLWPLK